MSDAGSGPLSLQGRGAGQGGALLPPHHLGVLCPALGSAQQQAGGQARRRTLVRGADVPPYRRSVGHVPRCPSEWADFCGNRENWDVPGFFCSPPACGKDGQLHDPIRSAGARCSSFSLGSRGMRGGCALLRAPAWLSCLLPKTCPPASLTTSHPQSFSYPT